MRIGSSISKDHYICVHAGEVALVHMSIALCECRSINYVPLTQHLVVRSELSRVGK